MEDGSFIDVWQQRLNEEVHKIGSEMAKQEAAVRKLMEELESERAQKETQVQKVMKLESEKAQVQKLVAENVRLHSMLDMKEAQLQAMSEQCKFMALNHHN